jgi:hypothetical protein
MIPFCLGFWIVNSIVFLLLAIIFHRMFPENWLFDWLFKAIDNSMSSTEENNGPTN